jgi:hypothetical protein
VAGFALQVLHVFYLEGLGGLQHLSCLQGTCRPEAPLNSGAHVTVPVPSGRLTFCWSRRCSFSAANGNFYMIRQQPWGSEITSP